MDPNLTAAMGQRHPQQTPQQIHGILPSANNMNPHQILPGSVPARSYGFMYPAATTAALVYPGSYGRQTESFRQMEGVGIRRELDFKKRPSMLSDFHLTSASQVIQPLPAEAQIARESDKRPRPELLSGVGRSQQIDSKKMPLPAYTPQVEAISPTPEDQPSSASSTNRDHILERISLIDHEIAVTESNLKKMQKRKQELEETAVSGGIETAPEPMEAAPACGGLIERIYAENRRKAEAAHAKMAHLCPPLGPLPLYREPSDLPEVQEIRAKYETFRPKLISYLRRIKRLKEIREHYLTERYNQLTLAWRKKVERMEKHPKRLAKEQKYREVFEKVFPELKKQREERERSARAGMLGPRASADDTTCFSSSNELEEDERVKMRQNAVVPPMLLDLYTRRRTQFINKNGLVRDAVTEHENRLDLFKFVWTDDEKRVFKEKFVQYGKNFAAIALFLDKKSTKDCVQYYYLTKKSENYKQMLRRKNTRRGRPYKPPQMPRPELMRDSGETADGEAPDNDTTAKELEFTCMVCKSKIDSSNPGRVLTRACYEQYGIDAEALHGQNVRICQKCRLGIVKKKHSQCPIGTCTTARRRVKPSRIFPAKWAELPDEERRAISEEFHFSLDVNKCCGSCFKRLQRRCEITVMVEESLNEEELIIARSEVWIDEEITQLKEAVASLGVNNWAAVADRLSKTAVQCRRQYLLQKQSNSETKSKAAAPKVSQVPGIEEEEEEEETVNTDEEDVSNAMPDGSMDSKPTSPKPRIKEESGASTFGISDSAKVDEAAVQPSEKPPASLEAIPPKPEHISSLDDASKLLSQSRESVRSGGDDSSATLSAEEDQSETEGGSRPSATAPKTVKVEDVIAKGNSPTEQPTPAVFQFGRATDPYRGSLPPKSLPTCQPYKPKSAHIFRMEKERRAKEAAVLVSSASISSSAVAVNISTTAAATSTAPSMLPVAPSPSLPSTHPVVVSSSSNVITMSSTMISRMEPAANRHSTTSMLPASKLLLRNTESPEVIEIVSPKPSTRPKSPQTHVQYGNTSSHLDNRSRGSLTQGTPIIPPNAPGMNAIFMRPPMNSASIAPGHSRVSTPAAVAASSSMEIIHRPNTPIGITATQTRNEDLHHARAASVGTAKSNRPSSSDTIQIQMHQQPPRNTSTMGNLDQQQHQQLYQNLLTGQALANEQYIRARQMGLSEQQSIAVYNSALNAAVSREQAAYANALANSQQQQQQQLQLSQEFQQAVMAASSAQAKAPEAAAQALLALQLHGLDPALIQHHYYNQQLEQRRIEQQRLLDQQRVLAAVEHQQRIMAAAAAEQQKIDQQNLIRQEQQRVAMELANQERLRQHEQQQEQLRHDRMQAEALQEYRRQLLEQQRLMDQQRTSHRQSPLTIPQQQHGHVAAAVHQQYQAQLDQAAAATRQGIQQQKSTPQPTVKQEIVNQFQREMWTPTNQQNQAAMAAAVRAHQELQKQHQQQQLDQKRQLKNLATGTSRQSIIQRGSGTSTTDNSPFQMLGINERTRSVQSSVMTQPQPMSTPPAAAGIPTKGAMKEFPSTLSHSSATVRTITPSPLHQAPPSHGGTFPIPANSRQPQMPPVHHAVPTSTIMKQHHGTSMMEMPTTLAVEKPKRRINSPASSGSISAIISSTGGGAGTVSSQQISMVSTQSAPSTSGQSTVTTSAKKADVNLVTLVDSIITQQHRDDKSMAKEFTTPVSMFGFPFPPRYSTPVSTPASSAKKEDISPAIVPISPPATQPGPIQFREVEKLIETMQQKQVQLQSPPASIHSQSQGVTSHIQRVPEQSSTSTTGQRPALNSGAASRATFNQYIADIISSDYSAAPGSQLTPELKPPTESITIMDSGVARQAEPAIIVKQEEIPKEKRQQPIVQRPAPETKRDVQVVKSETPTVFEYDLEPVSPPEQPSEKSEIASTAPKPIATATSIGQPTSQTAALPMMWTPQIRSHVASPIEDVIHVANSASPAAPFVAWNVFTLPETGGEVIASGIAGMPSNDQPVGQSVADSGSAWNLSNVSSSTAEDMECSRAVAALLETEMRPDSASSRLPNTGVRDGGTSADPVGHCPLPTYEPLSDDES